MIGDKKVIVMMPAYNTASTIAKTYYDIPKEAVDEIILVNDGSSDDTPQVAESLGISVVAHEVNRGYGAAQKTGYAEALKRGADIVVMVHSDYQYDPTILMELVQPIASDEADMVTGTRIVGGSAVKEGMPLWKYVPNRILTKMENLFFGTNISDYHNGYRAYSREALEAIPFLRFSDKFDFDSEMLLHGAIRGFRIAEVPHPARYSAENSQMTFPQGVVYGLKILRLISTFQLARMGILRGDIFSVNNG
ncbi:glycosyltransferase family 2 protein [Nitrospinae bacterium AH_259_B05_G02_I21]|nr:glycosyltransferase family 2 protein [Nitrospinae bacterium AH_259_B05_G02_I21]MDA2931644.1 glycosyltransferase family 2 protein [Nitrospinae bacterium AH-259-F20]